jgi:hypothetical protein
MTQKVRYSGAGGILEGGFSDSCERMLTGLQTHYGMKPEALRFFSGHVEADRDCQHRQKINRAAVNY